MAFPALQHEFEAAEKTEGFASHQLLIKKLLESSEPEAIKFHFELLGKTKNAKLHQRLRAAFLKRGSAVEAFLIDRTQHDDSIIRRGDAIQLLGHLRCVGALDLIRSYLDNKEPLLRYKSIISLGWMGLRADVDRLGAHIKTESDPLLRGYTGTALRQFYLRDTAMKDRILAVLNLAAEQESDENALRLLIVSAQEVAGHNFGLKEDVDAATISGSAQDARGKFLKFMKAHPK